jgi:hypothetical protein
MDDALRTTGSSGGQGKKLADQMVETEHVDGVHASDGSCREVFGLLEAASSSVGCTCYEDVDLADRFEDLTYAREIGLRGGEGLDFSVGVGFLERFFCGCED